MKEPPEVFLAAVAALWASWVSGFSGL